MGTCFILKVLRSLTAPQNCPVIPFVGRGDTRPEDDRTAVQHGSCLIIVQVTTPASFLVAEARVELALKGL